MIGAFRWGQVAKNGLRTVAGERVEPNGSFWRYNGGCDLPFQSASYYTPMSLMIPANTSICAGKAGFHDMHIYAVAAKAPIFRPQHPLKLAISLVIHRQNIGNQSCLQIFAVFRSRNFVNNPIVNPC